MKTLLRAAKELTDKIWYDRHNSLAKKNEAGKKSVDPDIWKAAQLAAKKAEKKYGKENLGPWTDLEWGMLNGKLSALRWVLGNERDTLDT